jgi:hypothetical protein
MVEERKTLEQRATMTNIGRLRHSDFMYSRLRSFVIPSEVEESLNENV